MTDFAPMAPPQNIEAERSVLGAVLLSDAALAALIDERLIPEDFYRESHEHIFRAMLELGAAGASVDALTLAAHLDQAGLLELVGGRAAIEFLAGAVPDVSAFRSHARLVREAAADRRIAELAGELAASVNGHREGLRDALAVALDARRCLDVCASPNETWLAGEPMDPAAVTPEPAQPVPGFPFLPIGGGGAVIVGPTGGGRSSLLQACAYDAGRAGVSVAVLSGEITGPEFNARAADVADRRDDAITEDLRAQLARVRFLDLATVIQRAWEDPDRWVRDVGERFQVVGIDPLSTVASALGLDFDKSNAEFVAFYDRLVQPLVAYGVWTVLLDNVGHALEARTRAKGASAKSDRADLTFSCAPQPQPSGLVVRANKVRSVRAPFGRGAEWVFLRDTQAIEVRTDAASVFRPTVLMDRIMAVSTAEPGMTSRELRAAVKGNNTAKSDALRILIAEGLLDAQPDGATLRHYPAAGGTSTSRSHEGVPTVPPRSPAVPEPVPLECSPVPHDVRSGERGTHDDALDYRQQEVAP